MPGTLRRSFANRGGLRSPSPATRHRPRHTEQRRTRWAAGPRHPHRRVGVRPRRHRRRTRHPTHRPAAGSPGARWELTGVRGPVTVGSPPRRWPAAGGPDPPRPAPGHATGRRTHHGPLVTGRPATRTLWAEPDPQDRARRPDEPDGPDGPDSDSWAADDPTLMPWPDTDPDGSAQSVRPALWAR